jgi:signal transduction protein with GAF and PtsI domain
VRSPLKKLFHLLTIGHIQQWKPYVSKQVKEQKFTVDGNIQIWARPKEQVENAYKDRNNLRPEGNVFNSQSSAKPNIENDVSPEEAVKQIEG